MTWTYEGREFDPAEHPDAVGFVYLITHLGTGRRYVGKKLLKKKKKLIRKRRNKNVLVESDWREYTGSSRELNEDIERDPRVRREVLHLARSKGELSLLETREQIERDVLRDDSYYNSIINCRIHASHVL